MQEATTASGSILSESSRYFERPARPRWYQLGATVDFGSIGSEYIDERMMMICNSTYFFKTPEGTWPANNAPCTTPSAIRAACRKSPVFTTSRGTSAMGLAMLPVRREPRYRVSTKSGSGRALASMKCKLKHKSALSSHFTRQLNIYFDGLCSG